MPPTHRFLHNHYQKAASHQESILSDEGATQGDPAAMTFYAAGVKPLIDELHKIVEKLEHLTQSLFADCCNGIGKLKEIKLWWDKLIELGPKFGYHLKSSKSVLIVKDVSLLSEGEQLFKDTGIQIELSSSSNMYLPKYRRWYMMWLTRPRSHRMSHRLPYLPTPYISLIGGPMFNVLSPT